MILIKRLLFDVLFIFLGLFNTFGLYSQNTLRVPSVDSLADDAGLESIRIRLAEIQKKRPTVAIVLAGGGALGAAHVGALLYLEEKGVPIDLVVGNSMGGLMGGLYATGMSAVQMDSLIRSLDWSVIMSDRVPHRYYEVQKRKDKEQFLADIPFHYDEEEWVRRQSVGTDEPPRIQDALASLPEGYLYGLNVFNMISSLTVGYQGNIDFMDLPTSFICTATDIASGRMKNWMSGSLIDALRSTMSIPVFFTPIRSDDKVYIDGGIRNNFPEDIARAAGADIIIGVDLHLPSTLQEAGSAAQIGAMSLIMPGASESYWNNRRDVDILIDPKLDDYNILSFTTRAVDEIIIRGYDAALKVAGQIDSVVAITGTTERKLNNPKATDTGKESVRITSISFNGFTDEEADFFAGRVKLEPGKSYDKKDFEKEVAGIFGTGAYKGVRYSLLGSREPYDLEFTGIRNPEHQLLLGVRGDIEDYLSVLAGVRFNGTKLWGSKFEVLARIGASSSLNLGWRYVPKYGPSINAAAKMSYTVAKFDSSINSDEASKPVLRFQRNQVSVFLAGNGKSSVDFNLGAKIENQPYIAWAGSPKLSSASFTSYFAYAFANTSINTLDKAYFPSKGVKGSISYDYGLTPGCWTDYFAFSFSPVLSLGSKFAILPSAYGRFVLEHDGCTRVNWFRSNMIGGNMYGRYFEDLIPFFGINSVKPVSDNLLLANLELRCEVIDNGYLSLIGSAYNDTPDYMAGWQENNVFALGLKGSYDTRFGPVTANIHYCTDSGSFGAYFGFGFDF